MSSVLDRPALEESPLADLHLIAGQIGIDGFRRLRKSDLIDAIVARQAGEELPAAGDQAPADDAEEAPRARRARGRGDRSRGRRDDDPEAATAEAEQAAASAGSEDDEDEAAGRRSRRGRRGGRRDEGADERSVEGVVELQGNGSGFVRVNHPETGDDDVYVSAAQIKRCELVTGDRIAGPVRAPRRSERYPSLVRIDTINSRPADEVAGDTRFDDLPAVFPTTRFELDDKDPTVKAVTWLTPFGRGSRIVVTGGPRAGKTELLRRLALGLAAVEDVEVFTVLAGARPEELGEWTGDAAPAAANTFAASSDTQVQAIEQVVEQARRVAARGGHAAVVVDSLQYVSPSAARRAMAAARCIKDGGSLTIIAAAPEPLGGETTVIALDAGLTSLGRFPAIDLARSGTLRPELLVKAAGTKKIQKARAEAQA